MLPASNSCLGHPEFFMVLSTPLVKLKLYSLLLWIYRPRVQQHVWILLSLHGGNTLFTNAGSPNISCKTVTHFSIAQQTPRNGSSLSFFSLCGSLKGLTFLWGACGKRTLCRRACRLRQWNCQVQNNQILFILQSHFPPVPLQLWVHTQKASGNDCYLKLRQINIADLLMFN